MFRSMILLLAGMFLSAGLAFAVDANTASQADLETVKGIGPTLAERIVTERKKGPYKSMQDLQERVKGIGENSIKKLAEGGLTVGGGGRVSTTKPAGTDAKAKSADSGDGAKKGSGSAKAKSDTKAKATEKAGSTKKPAAGKSGDAEKGAKKS